LGKSLTEFSEQLFKKDKSYLEQLEEEEKKKQQED
jgi:hypothetical protein